MATITSPKSRIVTDSNMNPSPLLKMTQTTPTCLWNDSAAETELLYSISHGATGATCNPVIVLDVLKKEKVLWDKRVLGLVQEMPGATEEEIAWRLVEEISATRAGLLQSIFERHQGRNGRLSIQTDPRYYRSESKLLQQAIRFESIAPNMPRASPTTCAVAAVPRNWQPPPGEAQARQPTSAASSTEINPWA